MSASDEPTGIGVVNLTPAERNRRTCERKGGREGAFSSWAVARSVAKRLNRKRSFHDDRHVEPYTCPHCKGIHLGSQPKRSKKGHRT